MSLFGDKMINLKQTALTMDQKTFSCIKIIKLGTNMFHKIEQEMDKSGQFNKKSNSPKDDTYKIYGIPIKIDPIVPDDEIWLVYSKNKE